MRCFIALDTEKYREIFAEFMPDIVKKQLHLTLYFFDDLDEEKRKNIVNRLEKISITPITASSKKLFTLGHEDTPKLYALDFSGNNEIEMLYKKIMKELSLSKKDFTPHITLLRPHQGEEVKKIPEIDVTFDTLVFLGSLPGEKEYRVLWQKKLY